MKKLLLASLLFIGCKKSNDNPTPVTPITPKALSNTHWVYIYDSARKMSFTKDSITQCTKYTSATYSYTALTNDTIVLNAQKYIVQIKGDTLTFVPPPYNVWDNKWAKRL